jgi:hypothetical protein
LIIDSEQISIAHNEKSPAFSAGLFLLYFHYNGPAEIVGQNIGGIDQRPFPV